MTEDLDGLRRTLQAALPQHVRSALAGYERFAAVEPPADAKGFAAWHAAAKAALAHVDVLVKLARWAENKAEEAPLDPETAMERMLAEARSALGDLGGEDEEEDA